MFYYWLVCLKLFTKEFINSFKLDLAHYLSISRNSWDLNRRFAVVNLKLISDIEKYRYIEKGIRGDISMICKGNTKVSKTFLKYYDTSKPASYIIYLDVNILYGHSMMGLFPSEILALVIPKDFTLHNCFSDSPISCFLEVNSAYRDELHDLHNDYPLASEKVKATEEMMCEYQLQII